jgi:hypothetical protein
MSTAGRPARAPLAALAVLGGLAVFVYFYRLGVPTWLGDEVVYRDAGYQYVHGDFHLALENPPLVKYLLGLVQVVFGSGHVAVRAPAALAGLLTGVVLFLFGRREAGIWAGVLAFALWVLLPRPELVGPYDIGQVKIDRYARQEVFMAFFATAALLAGWRWAESGRWRPALLGGVALGLAMACKAPAVLTLPAILLAGLVTLGLSRRTLLQAAAVCGAAALTAAATYLPMGGEARDAIDFMFTTSDWRDAIGHPFVFDGTLYQHAPWWANFWWQWKALGTPAALAVLACLVLSPFLLRRGPAVLLISAVLVPAGFLAFGLSYALPYYYYTWEPPLVLLCALVIHALVVRGGAARVAAAALTIPLLVAGLGVVRDVARIKKRDYAAVAALAPSLRPGPLVTWDLDSYTALGAEGSGRAVTFDPRGDSAPAAIIVDPASSGRRRNPTIIAYVRDNRRDLRRLEVDRLHVYVPRDAAAARRLAVASRKREPVNAGVVAIRACLAAQGLEPSVPAAIPGAPSQGVKAALSGTNRGNFWVYRSGAQAVEDARAIDGFLSRGGGSARARGRVVLGYSQAPTAAERDLLETCADRGERALGR